MFDAVFHIPKRPIARPTDDSTHNLSLVVMVNASFI